MKQVKLKVTNLVTNVVQEHWFPINAGVTTCMDDKEIVDIKVMEISCDEEHPVKHNVWGYDG